MTIITDIDKGLKSAMSTEDFKMSQFFCALHRTENIRKRFRAMAVAYFWKLVRCNFISELNSVKEEISQKLSKSEQDYIFEEPDELQFPISRINMGNLLYGHTTSGMVESMNNANMSCRVKYMDIFNSIIELVQLETSRYMKFKRLG